MAPQIVLYLIPNSFPTIDLFFQGYDSSRISACNRVLPVQRRPFRSRSFPQTFSLQQFGAQSVPADPQLHPGVPAVLARSEFGRPGDRRHAEALHQFTADADAQRMPFDADPQAVAVAPPTHSNLYQHQLPGGVQRLAGGVYRPADGGLA